MTGSMSRVETRTKTGLNQLLREHRRQEVLRLTRVLLIAGAWYQRRILVERRENKDPYVLELFSGFILTLSLGPTIDISHLCRLGRHLATEQHSSL